MSNHTQLTFSIKMKLQILVLFIVMFFVSCGKKYQCPKENLIPAYIGYADSEIDTIILRKFKIGSNFSQKIDSTILSPFSIPSSALFDRQGDTVNLRLAYAKNWFNDEYDWQIFNPFNQKQVSISDMQFQIKERTYRFSYCRSPLLSYKRNDTVITVSDEGAHYLFIHK